MPICYNFSIGIQSMEYLLKDADYDIIYKDGIK